MADALSRQRNGSSEEQKKYSSDLLKTVMTKTTLVNSISSLNLSDSFIEDLRKEYLTDKEFKYHFVKPSGHYKKQDGLLYFKDKICIPNGETRCKLLHDYHSTPIAGHLGKQKTYNRMKALYHWKGMKGTVKTYVKGCQNMSDDQSKKP